MRLNTSKYGNALFNRCTTAIFERKFLWVLRGSMLAENRVNFFRFNDSSEEGKSTERITVINCTFNEMDADNSGTLDASDHQTSSREGEFVDFAV